MRDYPRRLECLCTLLQGNSRELLMISFFIFYVNKIKIKIQIRGSQIVASNLILEMTADVWQRLSYV